MSNWSPPPVPEPAEPQLPPAAPQPGVPALAAVGAGVPSPKPKSGRKALKITAGVAAGLVGLVVIGAILDGGDDEEDSSTTTAVEIEDTSVAAAAPTASAPSGTDAPATSQAAPPAATVVVTLPPPADDPASDAMPAAVDAAAVRLESLTVADPDPDRAAYERDEYDGNGWADMDDDCISTRHEVLITYSLVDPVMDDCFVVSGQWIDPYDGTEYTDASTVTIDHVIPLAEAHRSGAWKWDTATKNLFANDEAPGHLLVVGPDANQAKSDSTPDKWMPPDPAAHCQYGIDWTTSKARYGLSVTAAEYAALLAALASCTPQSVVRPVVEVPDPVVVITVPVVTTTTTIAPTVGPGAVTVLSCDRRGEVVTITNPGGTAVSLANYELHDEDRNHETGLGVFGSLEPGQQLRILSGPNAAEAPGSVVWTRQNVWNNDGDTAYLITPDGATTTTSCR